MNLTIPKSHINTMSGLTDEVVDEDTNDTVGTVRFEKGVGRHIDLYDRYKCTVSSHDECVAFINGVQTVLTYMLD